MLTTQLDSFLPFQLDAVYSAASILHLMHLISPSLLQADSWSDDIQYILDNMIADGSPVAPSRKLELTHLENTMSALSPVADRSWGLAPAPDFDMNYVAHENLFPDIVSSDPSWDILMTNGMLSIPPQDLLDLADRLDDGYTNEE